jgi:hypothetical protein
MSKKETTISASKISTFKSCSWKFHAHYFLRIPEKTNLGALQGTCVHTILELLLKERHRDKYVQMTTNGSESSPVIDRYVRKYVKANKMPEESVAAIQEMALVGLKTDYFCAGGAMREPEFAFDISSENPKYRIKGFMDKAAVYGDWHRVVDFKSSKQTYQGEELTENTQAKMYSLASRKLWPELKPVVDFVFLQFPADPVKRVKFTDEQLNEFEEYLGEVYEKIDKFTEKDASSNFAAEKYPQGKGFNGKLQCGWNYKQGHIQSPDETKKDGSPKFRCPYRFPMEYLALVNDETGEIAHTCFLDEILKPREGHSIIQKKYRGCKFFYPEAY